MFCKIKSDISLFLFVATSYFYTLQFCCSVSLGQRDDSATDKVQLSASSRTEPHEHGQQGPSMEPATTNRRPLKSSILEAPELRRDSEILLGNFRDPKVDKTDTNFSFNNSSWVVGKIRTETGSAVPGSEDGYQADFTGLPAVKGHILGMLSDSSPHYSHWEAMKPLVECGENAMIFTASGPGSLHMQVDRKEGYPISIFHLPPYCGYSVKTSQLDLEMIVPYSGCYITQENGSYVLPMWWLNTPLKLSCPVKMPTSPTLFSPSSPSVFCSPYGMAVQIQGLQHDTPLLGVMVNGVWGPFVSELCAFHVDSQLQEHIFLISDSASCITTDGGLQLHLTLDNHEYILSCPVIPQFPYAHSSPESPSFRRDPQFSSIPNPVNPKPIFSDSNPSQTQNKDHTAQLPNYLHYYPYLLGLQSQQLSQAYLPPPESFSLPQPTTVGTPESKQQFQYHLESGKMSFSFGQHLPHLPHSHHPVQDHFSHQVFKPSVNPQQYPLFFYYPHQPFHYMASNPVVQEHPKPQASSYYTEYSPQIPYQPEHTDSPVTQVPAPHPASLPKQPKDPHQTGAFNPPFSYYPHQPVSYPDLLVSPTATTTDSASYSFGQFDAHHPLPPPTHPPSAGQEPQKAHGICLPSDDATCHYNTNAYYPYHAFYPQHYYPPHPSLPHDSKTKMTKIPLHLQCLKDRMFVFLPHAEPESIQVRDDQNKWWSLSNVSSHCGYVLQMAVGHGVILQSPLPACHSHIQTPTTISLPIKYWDFSIMQNRTEALQCPYQGLPVALTPAPMYTPPTPPRGIQGKTSASIDLKAEVFCSFQQMNVVLPPGPITEIVVKDFKGNQINQIASAEDCGYYATKGKDGKIHVTLHFHSHCPMSVQDEMYITSIIYVTESGRKDARFSCPVVIPRTGHECNLQSEYRLPCGSSSISQTQCLSIGCCFNKHPPACYYAMDECTIDRHMIFSVPASLTNPPLSPALLVAANNSTCKPQKATSDYALFNIPMDGCGTRRVMVGKTVVYMVEVTNMLQAVSLNYGTITRDSPIRLLVECRYVPGTALTVSYVVKTPTFGPDVHSQGVLGVQLRIAKDAQYSSYYPQYHQPLHMLLGKPLYLEVRLLNSPDPSLVLLVHFCVAYPRSGKAVWVLLYNGCPNPLDPVPPKTVLSKPQPSSPQSQTRRFTISTFQFLPDGELKDMDEEIYFMCSTEICSPHDGPCVEGCFGH